MKKLLPETRKNKPQIIVTNLIDVILLLVFFFMITSSFARENRKLEIDLPSASTSAVIEGETMNVQIDREGALMLNGKGLSVEELKSEVVKYVAQDHTRTILVEADTKANYGEIIKILDGIRAAGGINIGLSTRFGHEPRKN